ncbi:MAG: hypothetical protein MHM6MM_003841 [Cercozoa sp. M6MM]
MKSEHGANLTHANRGGDTAVHIAVCARHFDCADLLLSRLSREINETEDKTVYKRIWMHGPETLLMLAAFFKAPVKTVQLVLTFAQKLMPHRTLNEIVDTLDQRNATALAHALQAQHVSLVRFLVTKCGASCGGAAKDIVEVMRNTKNPSVVTQEVVAIFDQAERVRQQTLQTLLNAQSQPQLEKPPKNKKKRKNKPKNAQRKVESPKPKPQRREPQKPEPQKPEAQKTEPTSPSLRFADVLRASAHQSTTVPVLAPKRTNQDTLSVTTHDDRQTERTQIRQTMSPENELRMLLPIADDLGLELRHLVAPMHELEQLSSAQLLALRDLHARRQADCADAALNRATRASLQLPALHDRVDSTIAELRLLRQEVAQLRQQVREID